MRRTRPAPAAVMRAFDMVLFLCFAEMACQLP